MIGSYGNSDGPSLILYGHMDTVPIYDGWTKDPFGAEIIDGKIYGRGACDDKSCVTTEIFATRALIESGIDFKGKLTVVSAVDEETGGFNGVKLLLDKKSYMMFDSSLGWDIRPDASNAFAQSNSQGIRASHDYKLKPPPEKIRIATFGDSFTHCNGVSNKETWQEQISQLNNNFEILNFGVGGYGLDQSFLRYLEKSVQFSSHIVFIYCPVRVWSFKLFVEFRLKN